MRELEVDALGLLAENVHLLHLRHFQQAALDVFRDVGELTEADAVALDGIEEPVYVSVLVVEDRADDAVGQLEPNVVELLARLVPGLALILLRGSADAR